MKTVNHMTSELDAAYCELQKLVREAGEVDAALLDAQNELTDARSREILNREPKELGANEAQREAKLQEVTCRERHAVRNLECKKAVLRFKLEEARLRAEHARADLRLLEVSVRAIDGLRDLEQSGF